MKYGYPIKFGPNLVPEVEFAVNNFDFIEFTLELDENTLDFLPSLTEVDIKKIKDLTNNYELMAHFDWDINPFEHLTEIEESIKVLKKLGVHAITMHAYKNSETLEESISNAFELVSKIDKLCKENDIKLRLENDAKGFFSKEENFLLLINKISDIGITLDVGHANKISEQELDLFLKNFAGKIQHIHLHKNIGQTDHLFFEDKKEFDALISKILSIKYNGTITLETHFVIENGQKVYLNHREMLGKRREMFTKQSQIIGL